MENYYEIRRDYPQEHLYQGKAVGNGQAGAGRQ
jgi:hypothetical protein